MSQTSLARLRAYDGVSCEMIPYASVPNTNAKGFIGRLPNQLIGPISLSKVSHL